MSRAPLLLVALLAAGAAAQDAAFVRASGDLARALRERRLAGEPRAALALAEDAAPRLLRESRVAGELALARFAAGDVEGALETVAAWAAVERVATPLAVARARVRLLAGASAEALAIADAGLARQPHKPDWRAVRVEALAQLGRFDEARADLDALARDGPPGLVEPLRIELALARADALDDEPEQLGELVELLEAAVARDPSRADVRLDLVLALIRWHREDRAEAVARAGLAEAAGADRADLLYGLGVVQRARMDVDASLATFEEALGIAPGHALARVGIARSLLRQGDADGAARVVDALIDERGGSVEAWLAKAQIELARAEPDAALAALRPLLEARPAHARGHYLAARALAMAGRPEESAEHVLAHRRLAQGR